MDGPSPDDLQNLVMQAMQDKESAKTELYRRYCKFVERRFSEARRRRNWFWLSDLSEAVQDVFVQFFKALSDGKFRYENENRLKGFLVQTSFFVAMNLKDKLPREKLFSQFEDESGDSALSGLLSFADGAITEKERESCMKIFYAAVEELKAGRRDVIKRTLLGQKVREICAATNKTPASISGLKHHALKDLRTILVQQGFLEHCAEAMQILGSKQS